MTEAMPFLRKCDITFLQPPPFGRGCVFLCVVVFYFVTGEAAAVLYTEIAPHETEI